MTNNVHDNLLWCESFRPHNIDDAILPARIKRVFQEYIDSGEIKSYTAAGAPGSGKTSSAKALLEQLDIEYMVINASENGNIDTIRTKVRAYASRFSMTGKYRVIILDEGDYLTPTAQAALRGIIEEFAQNCRFIITANYGNRIIEAIKSRCPLIDFTFDSSEKKEMMVQFLPRAQKMLQDNNIQFDKKDLINFSLKMFPDFRRTINLLQQNSIGGVLELKNSGGASEEKIKELIGYLKTANFVEMRKWVAENMDSDAALIRHELYDKSQSILHNDSIPVMIMLLNDYDRHEINVKDKEIHMVAMCLQIMQECQFK